MYKTRLHTPTLSTVLKVACGATLVLAAAFAQAQGTLPPAQHQGSIEYISGGIGLDESTAFKAAMSQYPLALTFASTGAGSDTAAYVSEVQVVIRDTNDANVLNATSEGPYFLVKLPPGQYQVFATYNNNETQSQKVSIDGTGSSRATFTWSRPKTGSD